MRGDRLREAIKLKEDDALSKPTFVDARRQPACQEAPARRLQCWASKFGIRNQSLLVTYRTVRANPICLSHGLDECLCQRYTCLQ